MHTNQSFPLKIWWLIGYFLLLSVYAVFSYSLTDPNLIISSWPPYWNFQTWMWQTFFNNPRLLTYSYLGIILLIQSWWLYGMWRASRTTSPASSKNRNWWLATLGLFLVPLFFSYNALSHDVFNYMFNAKMVVLFKADPHVKVALDFAYDDWTRFMHNTHTPAPYWYGWTAASLVPYTLGFGRFLTTWLSFRLFSILSLVVLFNLTWKSIQAWTKKNPNWVLIGTFFNPLMLLEIVSNSHNDLWMMVPAVASLVLLAGRKRSVLAVIFSAILLGLSASTKLATLVLIPTWLLLCFFPKHPVLKKTWSILAILSLFTPLLTARSQQFHPWYLSWLLVWWPYLVVVFSDQSNVPQKIFGLKLGQLMKQLQQPVVRVISVGLIALSVSSLWRYAPWMLNGNFDGAVLFQQKTLTWAPFILAVLGSIMYEVFVGKKHES